MWVIFEGLDKAGKTTLEWEFLKATNFKHVVIDRGPIGYMVLDRIFGRATPAGDFGFIRQARKCAKSNDNLVVYCYCDKSIVDARLKEHNETCPYDYVKAQRSYLANVKRYYNEGKTLLLDTSNKSIDECVKLICEKLAEVRNEL